jgi:hypothetical protein
MIDRETGKTVVYDYATFDTYAEACAFRDRHELEFRACGWAGVVIPR